MSQIIRPAPPLINNLRNRISAAPQLKDYLTQLSTLSGLTISDIQTSLNGNSIQLLSQTANLSGVVFNVATSGLYLISVQHETMFAGAAGTLRTSISWTDEAGAKTRIIATDIDLSIPDEEDGIAIVRAIGGSQITYSTNVTGAAGSPTYNVFLFSKQMS